MNNKANRRYIVDKKWLATAAMQKIMKIVLELIDALSLKTSNLKNNRRAYETIIPEITPGNK
jgi:hypothetical protein